jgi:hypothetical protein
MIAHELPDPGDKIGQLGQALRHALAHVVSKCERDAMIAGGTVPDGTWTDLKATITAAVTAIEATEAAP